MITIATVTYPTTTHAWGISLPGLVAGGADEEALDANLRLVIADHLSWVRRHGDDAAANAGNDLSYEIVERLDGTQFERTGGEFLFEAERTPLDTTELDVLLRRMAWAREDLLESVRGLADAVLDWAPPTSALRHVDTWAPEARTIRGIFEHVLQLEIYYRDGLRDGQSRGIFERPGEPAAERALTVELLRGLDDDALNQIYRPVRPGRTEPEDWNARKLVRRIISHERGHAAEIQQRRAWILVGVPA